MQVVFFRPGLGSVSPEVSLSWDGPVVDLLNRLPAGSLHFGAYAEQTCADFVAALSADREAVWHPLEVHNLRLRWDRLDPLCPERADGSDVPVWEAALFAEIERLCAGIEDPRHLPVLISGDLPHPVTRGGELLCRQVDVLRSERWEAGQPLWVVPPVAGGAEPGAAAGRGRKAGPGH